MPVLFVTIGLAAGVLSGLFGIGGGLVIVFALVTLAKMPIHVATGTSLAAMLLPVGILGVNVYWKAGHLDWRAAALISLGISGGSSSGLASHRGWRPSSCSGASRPLSG